MSLIAPTELARLNLLIWGKDSVNGDIFKRWCQGFSFSSSEPSALIQDSGGPCAILASVQAVILRELLVVHKRTLSDLQDVDNIDLLISALVEIMVLVNQRTSDPVWFWTYWTNADEQSLSTGEVVDYPVTPEAFFHGLRTVKAGSRDELYAIVLSLAPELHTSSAILCFLYSVLLTHGYSALRTALADETETLIDPIHGHASQCLINLLISGQATPYLFDRERNVAGLAMTGILKQPAIGFLTVFEALRYCESGWYLKNPLYPVWILGSETHFTVLASPEVLLVTNEQSEANPSNRATLREAEVEFAKFSIDQDTNSSMMAVDRLGDLLQILKIPYTSQSLTDIAQKLDPEELGIILEQQFLQHFFPTEMANRRSAVRKFQVLHYNGLENSNTEGKVRYHLGDACLLDPTDDMEAGPPDNSPIHQCLRTKWPTIRVEWVNAQIPSLN